MGNRRLEEPRQPGDRARPSPPSRRGAGAWGVAVAVGLLAAGPATALEAAPDGLLTLGEAVQVSLEANFGVRAAALAVQADEEGISGARTRYLPVLSAQAHAGQLLAPVEVDFPRGAFGVVPGVGPLPGKDTTVRSSQDFTWGVTASFTQPLTQLYKAHQGVRIAEAGRDADRAQLDAQRAAVASDVKRLYYRLVATQGALAAAREQLAAQRELARVAQEQLFREAVLRSDELQARSAVAVAEAQVRSLENGLATGKEQLNRLLGRDVRTAFRVAEGVEAAFVAPDLEAARARALRDRPELRQARFLVAEAEADRRAKVWENVPEVSVGLSYTSNFNVETLPRNIAMAGAFARWDFDWGRRGNEAAQKALAIDEARAKLRDAEAAVLVEVGDRHRKLSEARDQVEATGLSLEGLRARAPVVANRFRLEAALLKDALDVQAALARAAQDHAQARLSLWSAQVDFEQALGVAP